MGNDRTLEKYGVEWRSHWQLKMTGHWKRIEKAKGEKMEEIPTSLLRTPVLKCRKNMIEGNI
jgi:hypothetical protein